MNMYTLRKFVFFHSVLLLLVNMQIVATTAVSTAVTVMRSPKNQEV